MMHFCSSLSKRYMTQDPCDSSAKSKTTGHGAYYEESYENIMPLCILCFRTRRAAINRTLVGLSTSFLYYMLSAGSQKTFNVESCALCSSVQKHSLKRNGCLGLLFEQTYPNLLNLKLPYPNVTVSLTFGVSLLRNSLRTSYAYAGINLGRCTWQIGYTRVFFGTAFQLSDTPIFACLPKTIEQRPMSARALPEIQLYSLMSSSLPSTNELSSLLFDGEQGWSQKWAERPCKLRNPSLHGFETMADNVEKTSQVFCFFSSGSTQFAVFYKTIHFSHMPWSIDQKFSCIAPMYRSDFERSYCMLSKNDLRHSHDCCTCGTKAF